MEQAGAGAIVFHSLFEEQIGSVAPEFRVDPKIYLDHIAEAKVASRPHHRHLNCTTPGAWLNYAPNHGSRCDALN